MSDGRCKIKSALKNQGADARYHLDLSLNAVTGQTVGLYSKSFCPKLGGDLLRPLAYAPCTESARSLNAARGYSSPSSLYKRILAQKKALVKWDFPQLCQMPASPHPSPTAPPSVALVERDRVSLYSTKLFGCKMKLRRTLCVLHRGRLCIFPQITATHFFPFPKIF